MIGNQAEASSNVVGHLYRWLSDRSDANFQLLLREAEAADRYRFAMEDNLIEAFVTPFDRQDIYSLSVEMGRVVEYTKSTLTEMEAFNVGTDPIILDMLRQLMEGTDQLVEAIELLKGNPRMSKIQIGHIRRAQLTIEAQYRAGMVDLFNNPDLMHALKYREVYHHIKDAAIHLGYTTDVLHKIVVRVV